MDKDIFVQNVKHYCKLRGMKPTVAFRECGIGTSFLNNIESRGQIPSVEKVQLLAQHLGVTTSQLLGEYMPEAAARDQPDSPARRKLHEIADTVTDYDIQKILDVTAIMLGKDLVVEVEKKNGPARDGTVDVETETCIVAGVPIEAGTPVPVGRYKCVGCVTYVEIETDGDKLGQCPSCGQIYWTRVK